MKVLFLICTLSAFSTVYAQDKCSAIIDWKYLGLVNIYDKPGGIVIHQIKNDSINEDFLHLDILDQSDAYFYVSISLTQNIDNRTGWIKKADYIGAYKKNEEFPMDLIIYKDKNLSDANKIVVRNWTPTLLTIEKCSDKWVFVSAKQNGQIRRGWIEIGELCANAYTSCN